MFVSFFFVILFVLLSVAFFTLLERKILGYSHVRLGPNSVFLLGVFQPFSDALKLFTKEVKKMKEFFFLFYVFSSFLFLLLSFMVWVVFFFWGVLFFSLFSFLIFLLMLGMGVYFFLYSGWSSNSKFSFIGGYRSSAQSISYEVLMVFCLVFFMFFWYMLGFYNMSSYSFFSISFLFFMLLFCWFLSCLAECNRSPFDFSEGESELVSGYNTEYGGGFFSLYFIAEYSFIIFFCLLTSFIYFCLFFVFSYFVLFLYFFLWVRSSFPRLRYDFLMMMSWKSLLYICFSCYYIGFFIF